MPPNNSLDPTQCPLCGSDMRLRFATKDYRRPLEPQTWDVVWCDTCRFGKIAADLQPEEVSRFYPANYYTHNSDVQPVSSVSLFDKLRLHLAWRFDNGSDLNPAEL